MEVYRRLRAPAEVIIIEVPQPRAPYGIKGVGEIGWFRPQGQLPKLCAPQMGDGEPACR